MLSSWLFVVSYYTTVNQLNCILSSLTHKLDLTKQQKFERAFAHMRQHVQQFQFIFFIQFELIEFGAPALHSYTLIFFVVSPPLPSCNSFHLCLVLSCYFWLLLTCYIIRYTLVYCVFIHTRIQTSTNITIIISFIDAYMVQCMQFQSIKMETGGTGGIGNKSIIA